MMHRRLVNRLGFNGLRRSARSVALGLLLPLASLLFILGETDVQADLGSDTPSTAQPTTQDFSRFRHSTSQHTRMPCLVCHIRSEGRTTPKMPGHIPCSSCHTQQFAEGNSSPICSICHTATGVKPFPPIRSFSAVFDHGRHAKQTNCATCHKPTRGGAALSIPSRANAHVTCFQCHGPRTVSGGKNIGSCSTCHLPGRLVRTQETSRSFGIFSHAEHGRKGLRCSECHTVRPGSRRGAQVTSPSASMHFSSAGTRSCASCHNDKRAFGANDFSDCKKCHDGNTFRF